MPDWVPLMRTVDGVGGGDRLRAGGFERGGEGVHAVVAACAGGEGVVGREAGPAVALLSELVKWTVPV